MGGGIEYGVWDMGYVMDETLGFGIVGLGLGLGLGLGVGVSDRGMGSICNWTNLEAT